jgi:peptidoglycan-N-acetylglucosamine deacetylase
MFHMKGFCRRARAGTRTPAIIGWLAGCLVALGALSCIHLPGSPRDAVSYWGFAAPWDPRSSATVGAHSSALAVTVSGWIGLDSATFRPIKLYPDTTTVESATRFALVTTSQGNRFHPDILRGVASDPRILAATAGAIGALVEEGRYKGVVLDFEEMTARDLDVLLATTKAVADSCRAHGAAIVVIAVPAADTTAYPSALLLASANYLMPMLYDQHWSGSAPGPIADPQWALRLLGGRVADVGATKVIAALPVYGYRWRTSAETEIVSYPDARRLAETTNTPLIRDPASGSLHAVSPQGWEMWVSDSELLETLVQQSRRIGVRNFALWRLGLEDPAIWNRVAGR